MSLFLLSSISWCTVVSPIFHKLVYCLLSSFIVSPLSPFLCLCLLIVHLFLSVSHVCLSHLLSFSHSLSFSNSYPLSYLLSLSLCHSLSLCLSLSLTHKHMHVRTHTCMHAHTRTHACTRTHTFSGSIFYLSLHPPPPHNLSLSVSYTHTFSLTCKPCVCHVCSRLTPPWATC